MKSRKRTAWILILLVLSAAAAGFLFWFLRSAPPALEERAAKVWTLGPARLVAWDSINTLLLTDGTRFYRQPVLPPDSAVQVTLTPAQFHSMLSPFPGIGLDPLPGNRTKLTLFQVRSIPAGPHAPRRPVAVTRQSAILGARVVDIPPSHRKPTDRCLWPLAIAIQGDRIAWTEAYQLTYSPLERFWRRYMTHRPDIPTENRIRFWVAHTDGTGMHLVGEGSLIYNGPVSPIQSGDMSCTFQRLHWFPEQKKIGFVWGNAVWLVNAE